MLDDAKEAVQSVAVSDNGRYMAAGSADRMLRNYDVASRRLLRSLAGHTGVVTSVAFSPDSRFAASGSYDKTIKLWNLDDGWSAHSRVTLDWLVDCVYPLTATGSYPDRRTRRYGLETWIPILRLQ